MNAMTSTEQIIAMSLAGGALVYVIIGKVQRMRLENHPEVRRMRATLEQVRLHLLQRADREAGRPFDEAPAELTDDLRHAIDQPKKLLVLCQGSRLTGPIGEGASEASQPNPPERTCAIFIVCQHDHHHRFAGAKDLERVAVVARDLGKLLQVPVEMV